MAKTPRVLMAVRLSPASVEWLDALAKDAGRTRSDAIRSALAVASRHQQELKAALGEQA